MDSIVPLCWLLSVLCKDWTEYAGLDIDISGLGCCMESIEGTGLICWSLLYTKSVLPVCCSGYARSSENPCSDWRSKSVCPRASSSIVKKVFAFDESILDKFGCLLDKLSSSMLIDWTLLSEDVSILSCVETRGWPPMLPCDWPSFRSRTVWGIPVLYVCGDSGGTDMGESVCVASECMTGSCSDKRWALMTPDLVLAASRFFDGPTAFFISLFLSGDESSSKFISL